MKINASISPNSLVTQMKAFAYERNYAFQTAQVDAALLTATEQIRVGQSVDDMKPIYDERGITLRAERTAGRGSGRLILPPDLFTMNYYEKTHLATLPMVLTPYLQPEVITSYQNCFYGELYERRGIVYTVEKDGDDIDISRDISYALHGTTEPLYEVSEIDESKDKVRWIPLAHEQRTLRVEQRIQEEQVDDQIDQLTYNARFEDFRDGIGNADFYAEFVGMRTSEAAICISALIGCLRHGSPIPAYDQLIDTV